MQTKSPGCYKFLPRKTPNYPSQATTTQPPPLPVPKAPLTPSLPASRVMQPQRCSTHLDTYYHNRPGKGVFAKEMDIQKNKKKNILTSM